MEIKYKGIKTNSNNNGVDIEYNISSNGDLYFFEKEWEWRCSTKEVGILLVNLNAGTNGRLELKINYEKPLKLGFDTEKPILTSSHPGLEIVFDFLLGYQIWTEFVMDVVNIMNNIQAITNVKLNELENKVILPISTVYTYKNVRISDDKTVLLFDTSYGTVAQ
jgi:hypothetical protein